MAWPPWAFYYVFHCSTPEHLNPAQEPGWFVYIFWWMLLLGAVHYPCQWQLANCFKWSNQIVLNEAINESKPPGSWAEPGNKIMQYIKKADGSRGGVPDTSAILWNVARVCFNKHSSNKHFQFVSSMWCEKFLQPETLLTPEQKHVNWQHTNCVAKKSTSNASEIIIQHHAVSQRMFKFAQAWLEMSSHLWQMAYKAKQNFDTVRTTYVPVFGIQNLPAWHNVH